jgi:hypothetical protein
MALHTDIKPNGVKIATSWEDVRINLFGRIIRRVTAISYSESQSKENFYGAGNEPVERGYGNKEYEGSITLTAPAVQQIHDSLPPGQSIVDIPPFTIPVFFKRKFNGPIEKHYLLQCEFNGRGRETETGGGQITEELELTIGKICWSEAQKIAWLSGAV